MATFPEWDRIVLELAYDVADYISLHVYYGNAEANTPNFLARALDLHRFLNAARAACDTVQAKRRERKVVNLALDEWNVWFQSLGEPEPHEWSVGQPRLEDTYTLDDALVIGSLLLTLLRHADRVKIACLAQLVNVIAPIRTELGGRAWRHATYFPFRHVAEFGRGRVLETVVDGPVDACQDFEAVPLVDAQAVQSFDGARLALFLLNRSVTDAVEAGLDLRDTGADGLLECDVMSGNDPKATNGPAGEPVAPKRVTPVSLSAGRGTVVLPPLSWTMLRVTRDNGC